MTKFNNPFEPKIIFLIFFFLFQLPSCGSENGSGTELPPFEPLPVINASTIIKGEWDIDYRIDLKATLSTFCRTWWNNAQKEYRLTADDLACTSSDQTDLPDGIEFIRMNENSGCSVSDQTINIFHDYEASYKAINEKCKFGAYENTTLAYDEEREKLTGPFFIKIFGDKSCIRGLTENYSCTFEGTIWGNRPEITDALKTLQTDEKNEGISRHLLFFWNE